MRLSPLSHSVASVTDLSTRVWGTRGAWTEQSSHWHPLASLLGTAGGGLSVGWRGVAHQESRAGASLCRDVAWVVDRACLQR